MNDAPLETDDSGEAVGTLGITLIELNTMYSKNNIHTVFEYGMGDFSHTSTSWTNSGYYLDIGYNLGSIIGMDGTFIESQALYLTKLSFLILSTIVLSFSKNPAIFLSLILFGTFAKTLKLFFRTSNSFKFTIISTV